MSVIEFPSNDAKTSMASDISEGLKLESPTFLYRKLSLNAPVANMEVLTIGE